MGVLILVLVMFGLFVVWKASREYILTKKETFWLKVALWGVQNFSPTGFFFIALVLAIFKVWLLFFVVVATWIVYRMIRKDLSDAGLLHVSH